MSNKKTGNGAAELPPPVKSKDVQAALNGLVYKHGRNLRQPDYADRNAILRSAGLDPDDLTPALWDAAEAALAKRVKAEADGRRLDWNLAPRHERWAACDVDIWDSSCGKYRLVRLVSRSKDRPPVYGAERKYSNGGGKDSWLSLEHDPTHGPGYARFYGTARAAADAVLKHHLRKHDLDTVKGNTDNVVAAMEAAPEPAPEPVPEPDEKEQADMQKGSEGHTMPLAGGTAGAAPDENSESEETPVVAATAEEAGVVKVKASALRAMAKAFGREVDDWNYKRLCRVVATPDRIQGWIETGEIPEKGTAEYRTLQTIQDAFQEGDEVVVVDDEAAGGGEANGHAKPARAKPAKADKAVAKEKTAKKREPREAGTPSNKEVVYKAWTKSRKKASADELTELVSGAVQLSTVRNWLSAWNRGQNLPACAKE